MSKKFPTSIIISPSGTLICVQFFAFPHGSNNEIFLFAWRRSAASRGGARVVQAADRAKRDQKVREQEAAATTIARREQMAAAAEARLKALSQQQQLW